MRSRNLILLLAGVTVALVTLFVSWRFGVVFFLLPLFFVWSWGGDGGERDEGGGTDVELSGGRTEGGGEDQPGRGRDEDERGDGPGGDQRRGDDGPAMGEEGPGRRPPARSGLDGEGI